MARILAVDDSESIRQMVELTLDDEDHEITTAEDGLVALNIAKEESFDVVITDINMPNMDGFELIRNLRELDSYKLTPILCLTTESGDTQKARGKEAGATGWIVKPFSAQKLISLVERVI